ncbi:MAG: zinc-dependent peptidase [Chitinophagaceae bacterium]|nr:zinc-dependent peptidase [Chitinophagaceae bacterium]
MPDTVYYHYPNDTIGNNDTSTVYIGIGDVEIPYQVTQKEEDNNFLDSFIIFAFVLFIAANSIFKRRIKEFLIQKGLWEDDTIAYSTESPIEKKYLTYHGKNLQFSNDELHIILIKFHPYYQQLNSTLQVIFIERLKAFMYKKIFIIHAKEGYKEMPILLSAAAIQITFGLDNYLLPYFKYLQIHPQEYFATNSFRVLAGHVYSNSITVAFNQLLKGYEAYDNGCNVALHEMAHALYFQEIVVNNTPKDSFAYFYNQIMQEGQEVYEQKHLNKLFSNYAFKELQEFWAESVELFFERPADLNNHFPELYVLMQKLLNQNPMMAKHPVLTD